MIKIKKFFQIRISIFYPLGKNIYILSPVYTEINFPANMHPCVVLSAKKAICRSGVPLEVTFEKTASAERSALGTNIKFLYENFQTS